MDGSIVPAAAAAPVAVSSAPFQRKNGPRPEVQAYTVQCSRCAQWRIVPSLELYESIRASVLERPWFCEDARMWRPDACCDVQGDIQLDGDGSGENGSLLWAMDKPNLPKTPDGWKREFVIRSQGCVRFGDIYYISPCGKRLRSMVEVARFLEEHPEYGLSLKEFSFAIPRPANKNYVAPRKRAHSTSLPEFLVEGCESQQQKLARATSEREALIEYQCHKGGCD